MRLHLPLALFAKSMRTTGCLASASRMLREHWRWLIPVAWALMSYLIVDYTNSHAVEKRRESLASMCDERARVLQYQVNAAINNLQALAILLSTFQHSKNLYSAIDQMTFSRYTERTVCEQPLTSGVAYGVRVNRTEREQFELQQGWSIKRMFSSKTKKLSKGPGNAMDAEVREPAEEYAPVIFAQNAYKHVISFDLLSGADDRDNILRARESGKVALTAPFKLLNNRIGVISTFAVYKYELPPNARPQERTEAAIGYLGGIIVIEALVDKLLHEVVVKQSIMVNVYDTTYGRPVNMYGSNDTGSGMCRVSPLCHVSTLNFGDPSRKHEMHCRFFQSPTWPWMAITSPIGTLLIALLIAMAITSSVGNLVIALLIAKRIARVEDEMIVLKTHAEDADFGKSQVISSTVELEQNEIVDHAEEKLDEADRSPEEVGMRSELITTVNKNFMSVSVHSLPYRLCYLNKNVVGVGLLGLMLCILVIGAFDLPFNQSLGIRREDENMLLNKFGWSHGRLLIDTLHGAWAKSDVKNSGMISVDLRRMTGNNDSSGQQQQQHHMYSLISSKYQEEATEMKNTAKAFCRLSKKKMKNGTAKPHLPAHTMSHNKTLVGIWIALVSVTVLVVGIAVVWVLLWCYRSKRVQQNELELSRGTIGPRRFQLRELVAATSNFADEKKLGQGGFGPVYKGYLHNQDCHVAIKVLSSEQQSEQGLRDFTTEVKVMTQLRHRNIVNLVGWCESGSQQLLLLVYELMARGSLDKHLYDPEEILTWQRRYKIVLDVGNALLYLHRDCEKCIVHGDIKPANVMLDGSYNAKLGDFGLARFIEHGEDPRTTQVIAGTPGYIDPEFIANRWPRTELDVYSFGVVLLEIACGKRPASRQPNGASSLLAWVIRLYDQGIILDAADQRLNGEFDRQQMERVLITGLWCAHRDPIQRPSIEQAMDVLRSADAELPVLRAAHDERHIRAMEEQAYGDLPVEDHTVHTVTTSTYFTSKDSAYLLAQE